MDDQQQERLNAQNEQENQENPTALAKLKKKFLPGFRISLLISIAVNFAMLVVGCYGVHKCPVNDNIPLFLLATGGIGLFSKFISYVRDRILQHFQVKYIESALYSVETVFLILGGFWVFKEFKPSFDPRDGVRYCNKTVYMFAFIYLVIFLALCVIIAVGFCCFIICIFFVQFTKDRNQPDPESQVQTNGTPPATTT